MKAKDFFLRARSAEQDIKRLESVIDHYRAVSSAKSVKLDAVRVQTSISSSRVEEAAICIVDSDKLLESEIKEYRQIVRDAEKVIKKISQDRFRQILSLHYLVGMSLADVGSRLGYNDRNSIYRAHGWALAAAQKVLDETK